MNRTSKRLGFTLVELLVVIIIIAILAGLLFPAIMYVRELVRQMQCRSNMRQVALALLTYETAKKSFPPLRGPLRPGVYWEPNVRNNSQANLKDRTTLTWVSFTLPYMEETTAWDQISNGIIEEHLYDLVLPLMKCRSSDGFAWGDNRINIVANAGPQNLVEPATPRAQEFGRQGRRIREAAMYTIFFDHIALNGEWDNAPPPIGYGPGCVMTSTVDGISRMDGASKTILLSENENAGNWIWYAESIQMPRAVYWVDEQVGLDDFHPPGFAIDVESSVAFCYPGYEDRRDNTSTLLLGALPGEIPTYIEPVTLGTDTNTSPLFINEGRAWSGYIADNVYRTTRPSSGHPGMVNVAFVDGSARKLSDDIDKTIFVRLARPHSRVIIGGTKEIFD